MTAEVYRLVDITKIRPELRFNVAGRKEIIVIPGMRQTEMPLERAKIVRVNTDRIRNK